MFWGQLLLLKLIKIISMKSILLIHLYVLTSYFSFAQIGVIQQGVGKVYVYKEASESSSVVRELAPKELFTFDYDEFSFDSTWITVYLPPNPYSIHRCSVYASKAYIKRSHILCLDSLRPFASKDVYLIFKIVHADSTKLYDTVCYTINGVSPNGLEIPLSESFEVKSMNLHWFGKNILISDSLYQDMYNAAFEVGTINSKMERFTTYKIDDTYFIVQGCSDGAGGYTLVWMIKDGIIRQRLLYQI